VGQPRRCRGAAEGRPGYIPIKQKSSRIGGLGGNGEGEGAQLHSLQSTSISLRSHSGFIAFLLRVHFDVTSISGRVVCCFCVLVPYVVFHV